MTIKKKIFHSKVLLFGEHIINKGAMGLAVPFKHYDGVLRFYDNLDNVKVAESNKSLQLLADYIIHHPTLSKLYDTNQLLDDIDNNLYFDSDIPQGYGLGSSGALVAAIYYQYRKGKKKNYVISELKQELAEIESYFHSKSSGLDPIVCFLDKGVLISKGEVAEVFDMPKPKAPQVKIFLINTGIARKTSPFVNLFLEKYNNKKFATSIEKSLVPATNIAIAGYMQSKYADFMKSVKIISQLHYDLMPEFIPEQNKEMWQYGLKTNQYYLKVCGAGGGGFILGFCKKDANLPMLLPGADITEMAEI